MGGAYNKYKQKLEEAEARKPEPFKTEGVVASVNDQGTLEVSDRSPLTYRNYVCVPSNDVPSFLAWAKALADDTPPSPIRPQDLIIPPDGYIIRIEDDTFYADARRKKYVVVPDPSIKEEEKDEDDLNGIYLAVGMGVGMLLGGSISTLVFG